MTANQRLNTLRRATVTTLRDLRSELTCFED